jgi:PAS domain S-box-containing protein
VPAHTQIGFLDIIMLPNHIIFQSAGSFSVAVLALIILILQTLLFVKKPKLTWYAWSMGVSFSAMLYAVGIFIEYNTPQGPLNRFSGLLEYMAIICLIHSMYGFTFSYFGMGNKKYHFLAGTWHVFILIVLWSTNYIVANEFASRDFLFLESPYIEPELGPLGPFFVLYSAVASLIGMVLCIKHAAELKYRDNYLLATGFWILLGVHDGLASMGVPAFQYFMEYGFLGFALVVLWSVFNDYIDNLAEEKYRVIIEFANDSILVIQDGRMVFGNQACRDLIGQPLTDSTPKDFLDIMAPEDKKKILEHYNTLLESGGHTINPHAIGIRRHDGEQRFVEIKSSAIQYRNGPAVVAILRDITERKREEEKRQESDRKIARLNKMESLGLLAGGVAHDLNNILSGIVSYPELILTDLPQDSKLRKPIRTIQKSGEMAVAIVHDLLTLARRGVIKTETTNLNHIISNYLKSPEYEKLLSFHSDVEVTAHLESNVLNIIGSSIHLSKTVMNLVSNAARPCRAAAG